MKKIKVTLFALLILYIYFLIPKYCIAVENTSYGIDSNVMNTAMNAMKINACAIKVGDDIICVVKDRATAESVIDAFFYNYAKCEND